MPTNLELKARIESRTQTLRLARRFCRYGGLLKQVDTYFNVRRGKLKLREFSKSKAELIYYERNEGKKERWSKYCIAPVANPPTMKKLLTTALGTRIVVRKSRDLFFYRGARIHVDAVSHLGSFFEIEVIVKRNKEKARAVFEEIIKIFDIRQKTVISGSYADLMEERFKIRLRRTRK